MQKNQLTEAISEIIEALKSGVNANDVWLEKFVRAKNRMLTTQIELWLKED